MNGQCLRSSATNLKLLHLQKFILHQRILWMLGFITWSKVKVRDSFLMSKAQESLSVKLNVKTTTWFRFHVSSSFVVSSKKSLEKSEVQPEIYFLKRTFLLAYRSCMSELSFIGIGSNTSYSTKSAEVGVRKMLNNANENLVLGPILSRAHWNKLVTEERIFKPQKVCNLIHSSQSAETDLLQ